MNFKVLFNVYLTSSNLVVVNILSSSSLLSFSSFVNCLFFWITVHTRAHTSYSYEHIWKTKSADLQINKVIIGVSLLTGMSSTTEE